MTWAFDDLMPDAVVITAFAKYSTAGTGQPTYSGASTYRARVVAGPVLVKGSSGRDVVATHTIWLATTATVGAKDKCAFGGSTFEIVSQSRLPDESGRHHTKLFCRGGV